MFAALVRETPTPVVLVIVPPEPTVVPLPVTVSPPTVPVLARTMPLVPPLAPMLKKVRPVAPIVTPDTLRAAAALVEASVLPPPLAMLSVPAPVALKVVVPVVAKLTPPLKLIVVEALLPEILTPSLRLLPVVALSNWTVPPVLFWMLMTTPSEVFRTEPL